MRCQQSTIVAGTLASPATIKLRALQRLYFSFLFEVPDSSFEVYDVARIVEGAPHSRSEPRAHCLVCLGHMAW